MNEIILILVFYTPHPQTHTPLYSLHNSHISYSPLTEIKPSNGSVFAWERVLRLFPYAVQKQTAGCPEGLYTPQQHQEWSGYHQLEVRLWILMRCHCESCFLHRAQSSSQRNWVCSLFLPAICKTWSWNLWSPYGEHNRSHRNYFVTMDVWFAVAHTLFSYGEIQLISEWESTQMPKLTFRVKRQNSAAVSRDDQPL